jgi:hypothetical protein
MTTNRKNLVARAFMAQGFAFALLLIMTGCGGSGSSKNSAITIAISPGSTTLSALQTQQFTATVANTSNTSVIWAVTGGGTISSAGLYTAPSVIPSSVAVSVTATSQADSSKSATIHVNLLPLTVAILEDPVDLGAGETRQFTAMVRKNPNIGVTWSLSRCTDPICGTITASGLYTSPSSIPSTTTIMVSATSQADPTKFNTVIVRLLPIAVSIGPANRAVPLGATTNIKASVQNDIKNAGVTWTLEPGCSAALCGTLTNATPTSVTYTAPASAVNPATVTLAAKSITDASKTAQVSITVSSTFSLKEGDYAFYYNGSEGDYSWIAVAGRFHADGHGNITDGIQDMNLASGLFQSVTFTGTYVVGTDYRGSFTITAAGGPSIFQMTVDPSGTRGQFIKFDALPGDLPISGTGYFEMQDKAAFSLPALAGPYAVGIYSGQREAAAAGRFTAIASGEFSDGRMDVTEHIYSGGYYTPTSTPNLTLTGSFGVPSSSTGRGMASIALTPSPPGGTGTFNFAYYIISDQKILLVQTDARTSSNTPVLCGEMRRQDGSFSVASFNAPTIFSISGVGLWGGPTATIGRIVPDGWGSITGAINLYSDDFYQNDSRNIFGTYTLESNGRSTIMWATPAPWSSGQTYIAYFFSQNQGFLLQFSGLAGLGRFKPQAVGPYSVNDISETFLAGTMAGLPGIDVEKSTGLTTFDGKGAVTSSMDITHSADLSHYDFTGRYAALGDGLYTMGFDSPTNRAMIFWAISPTELVGIANINPEENYSPVLVRYSK